MDMNNIKAKIVSFSEKNIFLYYLIIIILINLVGITLYFRLDLTKNGSYSLSEISRDVVSGLEDPLNIKVFFSPDLPAPYNSVDRYLRDLLEEYAEYGNNNFHYEFVDVEKNKDLARDYGISAVQIREIKDDQLQFRNAFMGVALIHGDLIEKLDSVTESEGLEYRLTMLIKKMTGKIDVLQSLDKPIQVTLYASSNLPISGMDKLNEKVSGVVEKCKVKNYNKIDFKYIDPFIDKTAGNPDQVFGVIKLNWTTTINIEGRSIKPGEGLLGLVVELNDRFETVQLLARTLFGGYAVGGLENLEDKINGAIDNIININPKIGYILGHGERNLGREREQDGAPFLKNLLSDMYEVQEIDLKENDIPSDISTLIVNGPNENFADYELFKLDQFLMSGKSILFLVDSFNEIRPEGNNMFGGRPVVIPINTGLDNLLVNYGVSVNRDIVCDEKSYKAQQKGLTGQQIYFVPMIGDEGLNDDSVITEYIKTIIIPKPSSLRILEDRIKDQQLKKTVLISSSKRSWLMKGKIDFMPFGITPAPEAEMAKYDLGVLLSGNFKSYFAGKEVPVKEDDSQKAKGGQAAAPKAAIIEKGVKPGNIIVVGTSELTAPGVIDEQGDSLNSVLMHNMVDYLSANYDVPEMRSKGLEYNPLEDSKDGTKLTLKLINIAGLPILVIGAGLVVWRRQKVRKDKIMNEFRGV
ncbi:MAG: Gldg family protein [Spirochaetes bacterium]|nr:Gldg family protein [Spirochaetota bacterium]